ncbi:MAG: four helix bundle protein [Kiritimatiellae bacterium]|nr:four helix bundle protein [Kiritimatiellia bacterium]
MGTLKTFETLECYILARELRKTVAKLRKRLPPEERYLLGSQFTRSTRSVTANIAEGYGRHHHKENVQFCRLARGSLSESLDHLNVALDEEYISSSEYTAIRGDIEHCWKVLNGYIVYLVRCDKKGVPAKDD